MSLPSNPVPLLPGPLIADFSNRRNSDWRKAMTISVRVASAADIDAIVRLNRDVQQLHAELEPSFFKSNVDSEEVAAFFAAKLALSENHIRLADGGDGPNGYVWFEVQERPEMPLTLARKRIYIHHLSVQARARRHGIASALLRQVEAEALISGITSIALDTWAANGSARSFFEACGFTPFNLSLGKRLT
jgi:ribosomal protein S18 acetylase RimI-like enzyme